ncbi:MAG: hypothetical protein HKO64_11495 [Xanthomonadales bacterium]|nr:hypothetical protein [Xanthomonadales bacterium]
MRHRITVCVLAGLVPILAVNGAYLFNISQGFEPCFPYFEGCASVSRAVRSGPGLWVFKIAALPAMILMWLSWNGVTTVQHGQAGASLSLIKLLGKTGALFFLVYALWLGTDGQIYRWLRRYGVVLYFAGTGLAHLLLARRVQKQGGTTVASRVYVTIVSLTWATGVASAFKRKLIADEIMLDRVENALEWNFALLLSLCFIAMAFLPGRSSEHRQ